MIVPDLYTTCVDTWKGHVFLVSLCVFAGANPYLTFHCSSQGTVLIDLAPDDKEFQSVEEEVRRHMNVDPTHTLSTCAVSQSVQLILSSFLRSYLFFQCLVEDRTFGFTTAQQLCTRCYESGSLLRCLL